MTAKNSVNDFDNIADKLRGVCSRAKASVGEMTQFEPVITKQQLEPARNLIKRSWSGFQSVRHSYIGDLLPKNSSRGKAAESAAHAGVVAGKSMQMVEDPNSESSKMADVLPTALIVAGLGCLTIVAVLTSGGSSTTDNNTASNAANQTQNVAARNVVEAPVATQAPKKRVQLAATISPVVFETDTNPANTKPETLPAVQPQPVTATQAKTSIVPKEDRFVAITTPTQAASAPASSKAEIEALAVARPNIEGSGAGKTSEQLQVLEGENARLREQMAALESETLNLNSELLQLELSIADTGSGADAQPAVETKTIYNFVNVPVGGGVVESAPIQNTDSYQNANSYQNTNNNQPANYENYVDNSLSGNQNQYAQQQDEPYMVADMPAPEMGFSADGQFMPPNDLLYQNNMNNGGQGGDPYFDQSGNLQPVGVANSSEEQLYGTGADLQYGAAPQPMDIRAYPPPPAPGN